MKCLILLYLIAFSTIASYAQAVKHQKSRRKPAEPGKSLGIKPLLLASLPPSGLHLLPNRLPLSQPSSVRSTTAITASLVSVERPISDTKNTPIRVANPALVEAIHAKPYLLPIDRAAIKGSYPLGISDRKTTHIIFPAKIREFDAGTDYVLAQIPETVTNVLRVKANPKATIFCQADSGRETNMTVLTDDGGFYSFLIRYQEEPEILNINMANNLSADDYTSRTLGINRATAITFTSSATLATGSGLTPNDLLYHCQRIDGRKAFIRNIGASKMRINSLLTGIYVADKIMYMQFAVSNDSQLDYEVDFFKFYVRDKDVLKRMAAQEMELKPYTRYPEILTLLRAKSERSLVYALPLTTLTEDKVIDVDLYEKDGGRHLRFQIEADVLRLAKPL